MTYLLQYHELSVLNFNSDFQSNLIPIPLTLRIQKLLPQLYHEENHLFSYSDNFLFRAKSTAKFGGGSGHTIFSIRRLRKGGYAV